MNQKFYNYRGPLVRCYSRPLYSSKKFMKIFSKKLFQKHEGMFGSYFGSYI